MTKICFQCHTENSSRAKHCTGCGSDLSHNPEAANGAAGTRRMTVVEEDARSGSRKQTVLEQPWQPEAAPDLPAGREIGNWVIDRCLGKGGMGAVYLAHNRTLGNVAAIKALSPALTGDAGFKSKLQREAS